MTGRIPSDKLAHPNNLLLSHKLFKDLYVQVKIIYPHEAFDFCLPPEGQEVVNLLVLLVVVVLGIISFFFH